MREVLKKIKSIKELYPYFFLMGNFLLTFIFFNIFLSSTLFIFKISITKITVIMP